MPAFGLVCLPLLIQMIKIWCTIFMDDEIKDQSNDNQNVKQNFFWFAFPNIFMSLAFGMLLQFGMPLFISYGNKFQFEPEESLLFSYVAISLYIIVSPVLKKKLKLNNINVVSTERNQKILNFLTITTLVIVMGALSLLNFSFALLIAILYVPAASLAVTNTDVKLFKLFKLILLILAMPVCYFTGLFFAYSSHFENKSLDNPQLISSIAHKLYNFALMAKISHIWTINLVNIFLIPMWSLLWYIAFPRL